MNTKEHKKHSDIARPSYGNFSRNEWAIVGTQCSAIQSLADKVIRALSPQYKCAYVDAKHANENEKSLSTLYRGRSYCGLHRSYRIIKNSILQKP